MDRLAAAFCSRNPRLRLIALGARGNDAQLDLAPFGVKARFLAAEDHPALCARYLEKNREAFGSLVLPQWVLSDLYLLPGAIGMLLGERDDELLAAYVGVPSVRPHELIGVSLISFAHGIGAGAWVKTLTLKMLKARRLRGVAQWDNKSLKVHTRLGPLRLVGPVPGAHELGGKSFVYETDLSDDARWEQAMERKLSLTPSRQVKTTDAAALGELLSRAAGGERIELIPPALNDAGEILIRDSFF